MNRVSKQTILNVALTAQDTDYEVSLPAGTMRFEVQCRDGTELRFYAHKGGAYRTIKIAPARSYRENNVTGARTFWLQSPAGNKVAEVVYWS